MKTRCPTLALLAMGVILALVSLCVAADPDVLTPAERAWLPQHPDIVLGIGEEWAPAVADYVATPDVVLDVERLFGHGGKHNPGDKGVARLSTGGCIPVLPGLAAVDRVRTP